MSTDERIASQLRSHVLNASEVLDGEEAAREGVRLAQELHRLLFADRELVQSKADLLEWADRRIIIDDKFVDLLADAMTEMPELDPKSRQEAIVAFIEVYKSRVEEGPGRFVLYDEAHRPV